MNTKHAAQGEPHLKCCVVASGGETHAGGMTTILFENGCLFNTLKK